MKAHSNNFKENIARIGKDLDSKITYEINGETTELGNEQLNSVTPRYNADILKSVMKILEIDSNVDIPVGTIVNYQFGVKVRNSYEYLNFGNYIVDKSEKQEDLNSYKITCYDKMLYSMVDYESMNITYPITIRNYINAICQHLGLTFKNINDTFANYNRIIQSELYLDSQGNSMGYKFRDVLDELAQVTGSTICINENDDELEIRYIAETNDIIDEDFFKDVNVNFNEKYGPVNSIVLSRSGGADNVYLKDDQSVEQNGLCEIKISDNQILNGNDRSDYLPDLLSRLGGLEYYLNDYSSPGIMYYELCDRYSVQIGENTYSCVMFNDDIEVTQGLIENVYTERPITSETDYSKADKTDRKINQTYFIVDKQNQTIQSVVSQTVDTSNPDSIASKQSVLTQRVDNIESSITDIADLTISGESTQATVNLDNINQSEPIVINVRPISQNVSYLYPRSNLYPNDTLYMTDRKVRFHNNTTNENIDYVLPDDLLYYDSENYDEFMLDYNSQTCKIMKKCEYNADGTVSLLDDPVINTYTYPSVELTDGDYTVSLLGYNTGYLFIRLMSKNIYTEQFYTKAETNSLINQTASSINLSVDSKLSNYSTTQEMNSAITLKANQITSEVSQTYATKATTNQLSSRITQNAESISSEVSRATGSESSLSSRISQTAKSIDLSVNNGSTSSGITITTTKEDGTTETEQGTIQMNGLVSFTNLSTSGQTQINGDNITTGTVKSQNYVVNQSGTKIDLTNGVIDSKNFKVNSNGQVSMKSATFDKGVIELESVDYSKIGIGQGYRGIQIAFDDNESKAQYQAYGLFLTGDLYDFNATLSRIGFQIYDKSGNNNEKMFCGVTETDTSSYGHLYLDNTNGTRTIILNGNTGNVRCVSLTQTSKEESKKNFEKLENALEIIKNTDIYKYHLKEQDNKEKKHIGFVIGDKFKYSKEITSQENDSVDLYSMIGVCFKAIQEQQEEIEKLKEMIKNG